MIGIFRKKKLPSLSARASKLLASGTQTYSRHACRYVEGVYPDYISHGNGPTLFDLDGNAYTDYVCSLGTNILGYADSVVNDAVIRQIHEGVLFSLPHPSEVALAEKINSMIPSMEMMRFLKSGSEAVSAGIKIARAYTGRNIVLSNGYHGWHDWSTPITPQNLGTPTHLSSTIFSFDYGDLDGLKQQLETYKVACVVLDPYIFDEPPAGYFDRLIRLAHKHGALVLFDEVVTGIRWRKYAVQNDYGVRPDLTALGKALANGFAISCIGGRRDVMQILDQGCFVSSTYGGELVGISAAIATLNIVTSMNVPTSLEESGNMLLDGLREVGLDCDGSPFRQRIKFETDAHKALFWQECLKRGVMFGSAQHTSLAHTPAIIDATLAVCEEAMKFCTTYYKNPKAMLEGKLPKPVSTVASLRR